MVLPCPSLIHEELNRVLCTTLPTAVPMKTTGSDVNAECSGDHGCSGYIMVSWAKIRLANRDSGKIRDLSVSGKEQVASVMGGVGRFMAVG